MPKRPCAVTLTPDDSTILCADKFGDLYSLPLLGQPYEPKETNDGFGNDSGKKLSKSPAQKFIPLATSLTVHTKRNLDALKQQQNLTRKKPEEKYLRFDHQLILGHVSLLTDVICTSISTNSYNRRDYILTSDRDEHVRVSRGIPQSHIIEGYCLGHSQFISKLSLIPSKPTLLISGGGDEYLLLWDWLAGAIKQKLALRDVVGNFIEMYLSERSLLHPNVDWANATAAGSAHNMKIAVSNIQVLEVQGDRVENNQTEVIITCEGIPSLFLFCFR